MGYSYYGDEERTLQRKLIPLNLFVAVLALIAAISLIFTPILTVNVAALAASISEMQTEEGSEGEGSDFLTEMFGDVSDVNISITAYDVSKVALAKREEKGAALVNTFVVETGVFGKMMNMMVNTMFTAMICSSSENAESFDLNELTEPLNAINAAKTKEEFNNAADAYITKTAALSKTTFDSETRSQILSSFGDMYDKTVEKVGGDNFSVEALFCVHISDQLKDEGIEKEFTSYTGLVEVLMSGELTDESLGGYLGGSTKLFQQIKGYAQYFDYAFYAMAGFAGVWGILFLFALFHILGRNKRFTMWYAKLFGGIPCLLFGGLTIVLQNATLLAALEPLLAAIGLALSFPLAGISTMTWISGVCYILMWLASIIWAFPIKHKIRKLRKND